MKKILILLVIILTLLTTGCKSEKDNDEIIGRVSYDYFDTVSYIYNYSSDSKETFEQVSNEVFDILNEYHKLLDIYHEYEGLNNLFTINHHPNEIIKVDKKLITFLKYCKEIYYLTDGTCNIMLGSVLSIWHDYRNEGNKVPDIQILQDANKHTSFDALVIDEENNTVMLNDDLASIDVGAIGKGYAIEKCAQYLREQNKNGYVLNVGGNICTIGTKKSGDAWLTGIRNPRVDDAFSLEIYLSNTTCVTSGDYERYYCVDGIRYAHIIDPKTLFPASYFASVTVICDDSALADALSTSLFCMNKEDGKQLVEKIGNVDVIWIDENQNVYYTKNLESKIKK